MPHIQLVASLSLLLFYAHVCEGENINSVTKTSEGTTDFKATTDPTEFLEESEKKKWQVKRLWDADFIEDAKDANSTRYSYKESLRKDAAHVNYVSAEGLPVDEEEIKQSNDDWVREQPSRRGDYVIETVEYDEEIPFDPEKECPGVVTVIELNMHEHLVYDLACRKTIIWNILES